MQTKKPEKEKAILKAARKEFKEHGFDGASMRRIAKTCCMTAGNLYHYHKDKEALLKDVTGDAILTTALFLEDPETFGILLESRLSKKGAIEILMNKVAPFELIKAVNGGE